MALKVFALRQSLDAFDHYQKQIAECDQQIAQHVRSLESKSDLGLKAARQRVIRKQRNQIKFNVREEAFRISGADLTRINGISGSATLGLISEIGINMSRTSGFLDSLLSPQVLTFKPRKLREIGIRGVRADAESRKPFEHRSGNEVGFFL